MVDSDAGILASTAQLTNPKLDATVRAEVSVNPSTKPTESRPPRRPYAKPTLTLLGDVVELTRMPKGIGPNNELPRTGNCSGAASTC
jgi:hypothetical protein